MMNKCFVIAGANSGIGLETVRRLARGNHEVYCLGRHHDRLAGMDHCTMVHFDAEDAEAKLDLPEVVDGLVYGPGSITLKPFHLLKDQDFLRDLEINLMGAVRLIRQCLPALKRSDSASIVLFSTVAVQTGMAYHASIASAKGAVEALTRSLAAELAPGIRVNCLAPSLHDTPLSARLLDSDAKREAAEARHPLQAVGNPADLAAWVEFLLSDAARFMTGQIIPVDGGLSSIRSL